METTKLFILKEIIEMGSMRKASEKLGYTQPALTAMMNSLEAELNIPLLKRDRHGVRLTPTGLELEPYINQLIEAEKQLRQKLCEYVPARTLRIGCYQTMAIYLLPQYINKFKEKYIDVDIELKIESTIQRQWLMDGSIDFGITDSYNAKGLEWLPLTKDTVYAAVHASSPLAHQEFVSLDELLKYPILLPTQNPNAFSNRILQGKKIPKHIDIVTTNAHTLLLLVNQGLGSALISKFYLQDAPIHVKMIPIFPPVEREIGVIAKSFDHISSLAKEFIQLLHSELN